MLPNRDISADCFLKAPLCRVKLWKLPYPALLAINLMAPVAQVVADLVENFLEPFCEH